MGLYFWISYGFVNQLISGQGPEYGVRKVFDHARKQSPCILVLEDLDSMVAGKVKSFFLNELDGLVSQYIYSP